MAQRVRHHFGLDLGTSNSGVAHWNPERERPELLPLASASRDPRSADPLKAPRMVPSATHLLDPKGFFSSSPLFRPLRDRMLWVQDSLIGREAHERNEAGVHRAFVPGFKMQLMREPERALARVRGRDVSAREVASRFFRELVRQVKEEHQLRIRSLSVATPVESFERFRAEIGRLARAAGVDALRFVDEPVAAAMGYGLSLDRDRKVFIVDIGGGTMHTANLAMSVRGARGGECRVLAKSGRPLGGDVVDRWLLEAFCERLGFELFSPGDEWDRVLWHRFMLEEARRVKEALFFEETEKFLITPPEDFRSLDARLRGEAKPLPVERADIVSILARNGFYDALEQSCDEVLATSGAPDDVLVVGGSTLLPDVYHRLEQRFGRDKVRAWSPFDAVAFGAAVFDANAFEHQDYVLHDYAVVTHDQATKQKQYTVVVPKGTRFPTPSDIWTRKLVPTCALGEPETIFKLVVCEIGRGEAGEQRLHFDEAGRLLKLQGSEQVVVPLNESNPTLGTLDPPHQPTDKRPRLQVGFSVNADRWLCATVKDLLTGKTLLDREPVVRLL